MLGASCSDMAPSVGHFPNYKQSKLDSTDTCWVFLELQNECPRHLLATLGTKAFDPYLFYHLQETFRIRNVSTKILILASGKSSNFV